MLIKLGVKDNNPSIYEEIFEEPFLLKVVEFYKVWIFDFERDVIFFVFCKKQGGTN